MAYAIDPTTPERNARRDADIGQSPLVQQVLMYCLFWQSAIPQLNAQPPSPVCTQARRTGRGFTGWKQRRHPTDCDRVAADKEPVVSRILDRSGLQLRARFGAGAVITCAKLALDVG